MADFFENLSNNPWAAIGGGLGAAEAMGDYNNPYDKMSPYLDQMRKELPQYYNPYIQAGQGALPSMQNAYKSMMDPNAFIKQIGAGYQESPGFQFQKNMGLQGINNAAAAGGMLGTPQNQQQAGELAGNLANQDFYNYLSKALGTYNRGLQGQEGLYNTGSQAGMDLGRGMSSILGQQGQLAFESQNSENQHKNAMLSQLMGAGSTILPYFMM